MTGRQTRVAVDIGGTFTDLVAADDGDLELSKAATTPSNFATGVLDAIEKSAVEPADIAQFVHGTTVVINAITERTGVDVALITTDGFRDVLDITRANRPDMFNFRYEKPEPFVPRRRRWEVGERVDQAGAVLEPLVEDDVREAAAAIREAGIEAVAVSYINAYANPEHERRTREILEEVHPEAFVTLSHELTQEYREYERTNTAALNAYVGPIADEYLSTLAAELESRGVDATTYAMQSNAGTSSFRQAKQSPVELVESGPVGGVFGAATVGEHIGKPDVISFDMGGTTAKTSLVEDGEVDIETDYWLESGPRDEGYPLKIPVVDIIEIGAGGGSIGWVDKGGSLNVGPKSAGADPGPACYGRGGADPTVTDAHVLTGRLNPEYFLGGEMELRPDLAREAMEPIADRFDTSVREAARGILRIVDSNMTNALKQVSIQRGYDPRDFVLVASGGAGALHAPTLGEELGVEEVVVPRAPGQFSAWGMLQTDPRRDYIRTEVTPFDADHRETVAGVFADLIEEAHADFEREGVAQGDVTVERSADLRYVGQEHTVTAPVATDDGVVTGASIEETIDRFHRRHDQTYNFRLDDPVEVVNLRVKATYPVQKPDLARREGGGSLEAARKETRSVDYDDAGEHETPVYERDRLPVGTSVPGPVVVEEPACTTLVTPTQKLRVDEYGNLGIS